MKRLCFLLTVLAVLAGYQSTHAADATKDTNSYATISEGIRLATLKDGKGAVIGERTEQYNKEWKMWFEVEKSGGKWKETNKGMNDRLDRIENCEGGCAAEDCP